MVKSGLTKAIVGRFFCCELRLFDGDTIEFETLLFFKVKSLTYAKQDTKIIKHKRIYVNCNLLSTCIDFMEYLYNLCNLIKIFL